jgi:hypothetical protein
MTTISILRPAAGVAVLALLLLAPQIVSAQEQLTTPSTSRIIGAPVGHRQPRLADIPAGDKSAAEQLEEKQTAELNRKLRICRGC